MKKKPALTVKQIRAAVKVLCKNRIEPIDGMLIYVLNTRKPSKSYALDGRDWEKTKWGYELKPNRRFFSKSLLALLKPQFGTLAGLKAITSAKGTTIRFTKYPPVNTQLSPE